MKELIISYYDGGCGFSAMVLDDELILERLHYARELIKFGLQNKEYYDFDDSLINKENEHIQMFDRIIVCEDGHIDIYRRGDDY